MPSMEKFVDVATCLYVDADTLLERHEDLIKEAQHKHLDDQAPQH